MSKRPVDIAHLKTLQRKRRALQSREAKEELEDKKNAVRQTTIDFFSRPTAERQPEANSQLSEEDNPFRLSSQTNAHAHNPFACSSQPDYSSQSSFSILESLSQQEFQNEYWSEEEDNVSEGEGKESEAMMESDSHKVVEISNTLDIKGTAPIVVKQKKNEDEDLEDSENRLVINLASQDDYKTFLTEDHSDGTESVDSDEMNDRVDHDDYDMSDEVFRFSRTTLVDDALDEKDHDVEQALDNDTTNGPVESNKSDVNDGRLLSVLKHKLDNATAISGAFDISKTVNSTPLNRGNTANVQLTQPLAPFDWALKTSLFITSTQSFDWLQTDARSQARSLSRFRSNHFADQNLLEYCRNPENVADDGYTISQCLYHWAYPNSTLSKDKIASNNRLLSKSAYTDQDKLDLQEWQTREDEWASSFRSLFDLLVIEECDYFYYIGITVCILFRSKRFVGEVEAIGSRSTVAFRRNLKDAGVNYILPYQTNDKENEVLSNEVLNDLEYLESINPGTTRQEKKTVTGENEKNSLFRVQGADDVQNLVDALVTWREPRTSDRAHGPPTLISPQSFLNSTLKCAEIEQRVVRKLTKSENSTEKASESVLYKFDVHGYILPTSLLLLYTILGRNTKLEKSFWVECSTQALTKGLNTTCENSLVSEWASQLPSIDQVQYTGNAYRIG